MVHDLWNSLHALSARGFVQDSEDHAEQENVQAAGLLHGVLADSVAVQMVQMVQPARSVDNAELLKQYEKSNSQIG